MLNFKIDQDECISCGLCAKDCPINIIELDDHKKPLIQNENEEKCMKCQHCFAVCPTGALSIFNLVEEDSINLKNAYPKKEQIEALIKGRRSVRFYKNDPIDKQEIHDILNVISHQPTGMNSRLVRFSVIDDLNAMNDIRENLYLELKTVESKGDIPEHLSFISNFIPLYFDQKVDVLFRGAPHLLIASAPKDSPSPTADTLISLTYFELYMASIGFGTVWDGLVKWSFSLAPKSFERLGIPENHEIGYMMAFGKPSFKYQRSVIRESLDIHVIE